ncbi:hydantoin racemase [Paenarthrobacter sp. DKR-5]|uniref:aspartate/glutamate racemase family protein n=1 Tax=Paenarthrobacter sp. DKR-5 TaxID=2835535 RepID=UPI001BDC6111|nr:aspartate/glutamate racemase family protein [Paenarthrobacter sp. DKR-5]MBT1004088.1 hydantoin racemase [Paenarthrobacter sp. DKR-5]
MRIGLIRALTTADPRLLHAHGGALERAFGFHVISKCIEGQPHGVYDAGSRAAAAPKVADLAEELAPDVDAIIISCTADPGLSESRGRVPVPVIGAGASAAAAALTFGGAVGVLGLSSSTASPIPQLLGDRLVHVDGAQGVERTTQLLTPTGVFETIYAAERLAAAGAEVIVQASTGLTSIGMAAELRRRLGLPVVDAVMAAGAMVAAGAASRELVTA